ncbi:MAG: J domain-containing protein [Alphaproteobacteria bacterium]|nr:J domain-containing protein [Alphaproteobacteria bacterium]
MHLDDGSQFLGMVSVMHGQRISELMNDERQFLPIQMPKGNVVILRKTAIFKVVPLDQHIEHDKIVDPYDILGVARGVSDEELTRFYHNAVKENHPDKVLSAGLSPQYLDMATSRMIRINEAYDRIVSMRQAAMALGQESDTAPDTHSPTGSAN